MGVKNIRCWGIVDDDGISNVSTELRKVLEHKENEAPKLTQQWMSCTDLYVVSTMIVTTLSEQTMSYCPFWIKPIENRIRIL